MRLYSSPHLFSSSIRVAKLKVRNLGKPVELAGQYYIDGSDEVRFLNITGFRDFPLGDLPMLQVLRHTSENVFVPLTIGGGIRDFTDSTGSDAVKTGKTSLEPIPRVYGNQVIQQPVVDRFLQQPLLIEIDSSDSHQK
ncbi:Imidazole glycerol phosphate synthase hisHF, chloroplastic [Orobanche gracilis]